MHTLRNPLPFLLPLLLLLFAVCPLRAQVELKLELLPDGQTYTVFARSQTDLLPPLGNLLHSAEVTAVVPTGGLAVTDLQGQIGEWELSHLIEKPMENPGADYAVFRLVAATSDGAFPEGQEVPLFSFANASGCTGGFELMDPQSDPFLPPNSLGMDIGQSFFAEGTNGEAYLGNYGPGSANCLDRADCALRLLLELLPSGKYQVSLLADANLAPGTALQSLRVAVKVPTSFFQLHQLKSAQPGQLQFMGISRNDAPSEAPGYDYLQFRLKSVSPDGLLLQPGTALPLLTFGNGGSCSGDSIFLVKNDDPFRSPNSQATDLGQRLQLVGNPGPQGVCIDGSGAAECLACAFPGEIIEVEEVAAAGPVVCLGAANGMLHILADAGAATNLQFSIDGGQNWAASSYFDSLTSGSYQPTVRGSYFGCEVLTSADPVELLDETTFELQLDIPLTVCESDVLALQIMSPSPLPMGTTYEWSGPLGFTAAIADPAIFSPNPLQSGQYSLTVSAPGCNPATATATATVVPLPETPTVLSNAPLCQGDTLTLATDVAGAKFEWLGPAGQSAATLGLPGLTTADGQTAIPPGHPAYLAGDWQVRVTDQFGCQAQSVSKNILLKNRPQAFAANDGPVCLGKPAQLLANPLAGAIYRWRKLGETDVFSQQPTAMLPNVTAQQSFELQVEVDGCASQNLAQTTVSLHPKPAAFPTFGYQAAPDCAPQDLQLSANASGMGLSYQWSGVNGFASQIENPTIAQATAVANGNYQLTVTNVHGCTALSPFEVAGVVDALPMPLLTSTGAVCPGGDILLSVQDYAGLPVSFTWFRNGSPLAGATSSQLNLDAVQPAIAGTYTVQLQAGACEIESAGLQVQVLPAPVAQPNFILTYPCEGSSLQFFSNSVGIVGWEWTGPNGFTSQAANPLIYNTEFDDVGAYALTVTAANGCTAAKAILVDGILPVPDQPQVATNSPVCPGENLVLTVQNPVSLGTVSYEWINGIGLPIAYGLPVLSLDPNDPLSIPPYLVRADVNGCQSELSDAIDVEVVPTPVASAANGGAVCPGEMAQLLAATVANGSYEWRIAGQGQVLSFEQNPQFPVNDTTTYELTVKTAGCQAQAVEVTTVFTKIKPEITGLTGGGSHCEGAAVQLVGSNSTPVSGNIQYTWSGPNGFDFTGTAPATATFPVTLDVLQPQNEGTYTLSLTSADGCVSLPQSVLVDYVAMPAPPVLNVADATLCQGETLQLDATPYAGTLVQYEWFFENGNGSQLLGSTSSPTFFVPDAMPSNAGLYGVSVSVDGCQPPASNLVPVTVFGLGPAPTASSSTTPADPACEGEDVELSVALVAGASYAWFGPAGFQSTSPSPLLAGVSMAQAGDYLVNISFANCATVLTANTTVHVAPRPAAPELVGPTLVCEGTDVTVAVTNGEPGAAYEFYFSPSNSLVEVGSVPQFLLENVIPGQSGSYHAVAQLGQCRSANSDAFELSISPDEIAAAYAGEPQVVCHVGELVFLAGNAPTVATGQWLPLDGGVALHSLQASTEVRNLQPGPNRFVWKLTHPVCQNSSTDTVTVFLENIEALPDFALVPTGDNPLEINMLENDWTAHAPAWDIFLLEKPRKGTVHLDTDGLASYSPWPNVFGDDSFSYRLCSMACPDVCDSALVRLTLAGTSVAEDCFVPNLITPNGDGENDVFVVPCAVQWPGSEIVVFNRYGSRVFQSSSYDNDWDGSYGGQPLPNGTYFYQLVLADGRGSLLAGYVVLNR